MKQIPSQNPIIAPTNHAFSLAAISTIGWTPASGTYLKQFSTVISFLQEHFGVSVDAYFLNLALCHETNVRPFQNGYIGKCESLLIAAVLHGLKENHWYWVQALNGHYLDERTQHINTVSAYSCAIERICPYKMISPNITPTAGELDAFIVSAASSAIMPAYLCYS